MCSPPTLEEHNGRVGPKVGRVSQKTLVRTYPNRVNFTTDAQKLGRQGWLVAAPARPDQPLGLMARLRAHVAAPQAAARIAVTYPRGQLS